MGFHFFQGLPLQDVVLVQDEMFKGIDAFLLPDSELFVLVHSFRNELERMGSNAAFCQIEARQDRALIKFMSILGQNLLAVIKSSIYLFWNASF